MSNEVVQFTLKPVMDINDIQSNVSTIQKYLNGLKLPSSFKQGFAETFRSLEKSIASYQDKMASNKPGDLTGLDKEAAEISKLFAKLEKQVQGIDGSALKTAFKGLDIQAIKDAEQKVTQLKQQLKEKVDASGFQQVKATLDQVGKASKNTNFTKFKEAFASGDIKAAEQALTQLEAKMKTLNQDGRAFAAYDTAIPKLKAALQELQNVQGLEQLRNQLKEAGIDLDKVVQTNFSQFQSGVQGAATQISQCSQNTQEWSTQLGNAAQQQTRLNSEIEQLKSRVQYFFSLTNSVMLLRRALTSAFNTVKELDAAMAETAVVTDFSVGDMWDKLPEYAENANKLGVSIRAAYEATTLYYQQGLKTQQAMELSNETLKMARIARMDAAQATDMMTAALRGFNMELTETSAQRVNDVYSELAAITAASTEEIATAMTKTASIANSANMEFETTAALLSQIIETTREAPETAGTAMKTIIARFTEVKELFSQGQLTGEDSEGEAIEINKIDTALKSVGISLSDFLNGTKGIDDIFLELASKWDTLDVATQRYIATTAAGSRQQSRFLAMMSDYGRTMELVNAANNSAGASNDQFNKTLETLETSLNKLKNAWDEFTMGIANNELIKGAVDTLTWILETINNLTSALPGPIDGFAKLGIVIGALVAGSKIFNALFAHFGAIFLQAGDKSGKSFAKGLTARISKIKLKIMGPKINMKAANKALAQYQVAVTKTNKVEKLRATTQTANNINTERQAKLDIIAANAENQKTAATAAYATATGLTMEQSAAALALQTLGISGDVAQMAAIGGLTSARMLEYQAQMIAMGLNKQEIATRMGNIAALYAENGARVLNNTTEGIGLKQKLINLGLLIKEKAILIGTTVAKIAQAGVTLLWAAANKIAEKTQWGVNGAMYACPLVWFIALIVAIIAAVALLVVGFIALINALQQETLAEKMEKAAERTEAAKKAAEAANTAYNELLDKRSQYEETQKSLSDMVKGTDEWRNALISANNQVLDLLDTYPELAKYMKKNADGVLTLSDEGWDIAEQQALTKAQAAQSGVYASSMVEQELKIEQAEVNLDENTKRELTEAEQSSIDQGYAYESDYQYAIEQDQKALENKMKEMQLDGTLYDANGNINKELEEFAYSLGYTEDSFYAAVASLEEYNASVDAATQSMILMAQQMIETNLSEEALNTEHGSTLAGGAGEFTADKITKNVQDETDKYYDDSKGQEQQVKDDLEAAGIESTGDELKDLQNLYVSKMGLNSVDDIDENIKEDKEALAQAIASANIGKDIAEQIEKVIEKTEKIRREKGEKAASYAAGLFSEGGQQLTTDYITSGIDSKKAIQDLKDMEYTEDEIMAMYGAETMAEAQGKIAERLNEAKDTFNAATEKWNDFSINGKNLGDKVRNSMAQIEAAFGEGLTLDTYAIISDAIGSVEMQGGDSELFTNQISQLLGEATSKGLGDKAMDIISSTDFSNSLSVENMMQALKDLGLQINDTMVDEILAASNAMKKFDIAAFTEKVSNAVSQIDNLFSADEKTIDKETYDQLMKSGIDQSMFVARGDEYYYLGNSMKELSKVLEDNTAAQIAKEKKDLENEMGVINQIDANVQGGQGYGNYNSVVEAVAAITSNEITGDQAGELAKQILSEFYGSEEQRAEWEGKVGDNATLIEYLKTWETRFIANAPETIANYKAFQEGMAETAFTIYSTGQELLNAEATNDTERQNKDDAFTRLLQVTQNAEGVYDDLIDQWENQGRTIGDNADLLKAHAIDVAQDREALQDFKDALSSNIDVLDSRNKGTAEYDAAMQEILDSLPDELAGIITSETIGNNQDLFKAIAQYGTGETFEEIEASIALGRQAVELLYQAIISKFPQQIQGVISQLYNSMSFGESTDLSSYYANAEKNGIDADYFTKLLGMIGITATGKDGVYEGTKNDVFRSAGDYEAAEENAREEQDRKDAMRNPFDWLYNLTAEMENRANELNRLENKYNQMLADRNATAQDIAKNLGQQVGQIQTQIALNEELIKRRQTEMQELFNQNQDLAKYAKYDEETNQFTIDYNAIENDAVRTGDQTLLDRVEEFVSQGEEIASGINDAQDEITDYQEQQMEIEENAQENYISMLNDVILNTYVEYQQMQIDKMSEQNEVINEANERLISSISSIIDKQRQERENAETEQEIIDAQNRLAYLQQDTSGANATEIMTLEDEITEMETDYTDTLIDQKISELEEQNEMAAEQRQQQIDIAQSQLDEAIITGEIWDEALETFQNSLDEDGSIKAGSTFQAMFDEVNGAAGKTTTEVTKMHDELDDKVKEGLAAQGVLTEAGMTTEQIKINEGISGSTDSITQSFNEGVSSVKGDASLSNLQTELNNIEQNGINKLIHQPLEEVKSKINSFSFRNGNDIAADLSDTDIEALIKAMTPEEGFGAGAGAGAGAAGGGNAAKEKTLKVASTYGQSGSFGWKINYDDLNAGKSDIGTAVINGTEYNYTATGNQKEAIIAAATKKAKEYGLGSGDKGTFFAYDGEAFVWTGSVAAKIIQENASDTDSVTVKNAIKGYKTGGLADYTGPAWLDGTPSKPEIVLNAQDTQNFLALRDILAEVMGKGSIGTTVDNSWQKESITKLVEQSEIAKNQRDTQIGLLTDILSQEQNSDSSTDAAVKAMEQHMVSIATQQGIVL